MEGKISTLLILVLLTNESIFAQIQTKEQAIETLDWIVDNPQLDSDSLLENRLTNLLGWQMLRYPNIAINIRGISEFQNNSTADYKLYGPIVSIYMCSTFINENYSISESAYYAMKNMLTYYKNSLEIDSLLRLKILEEYMSLSDSELKTKMKELSKYE